MPVIKKGSTDVTRYVMLRDSTAGTPETGYTITALDLQYTRNRTAPAAKVDAVALAATDTAHTDNRAIEVDATSSPGLYRIDWPDAAFATGADKVLLVVSGTGLDPAVEEIQLVDYDPENLDGRLLSAAAVTNVNAAANAIARGTADTGGSTTSVPLATCTPTPTVTDQFKGRIIMFANDTATAALRGQGAPIDGNTTTTITIAAGDALTTAPASGDVFVIQ